MRVPDCLPIASLVNVRIFWQNVRVPDCLPCLP